MFPLPHEPHAEALASSPLFITFTTLSRHDNYDERDGRYQLHIVGVSPPTQKHRSSSQLLAAFHVHDAQLYIYYTFKKGTDTIAKPSIITVVS